MNSKLEKIREINYQIKELTENGTLLNSQARGICKLLTLQKRNLTNLRGEYRKIFYNQ